MRESALWCTCDHGDGAGGNQLAIRFSLTKKALHTAPVSVLAQYLWWLHQRSLDGRKVDAIRLPAKFWTSPSNDLLAMNSKQLLSFPFAGHGRCLSSLLKRLRSCHLIVHYMEELWAPRICALSYHLEKMRNWSVRMTLHHLAPLSFRRLGDPFIVFPCHLGHSNL